MRPEVRLLYKELLYIGREYPKGTVVFNAMLKKGFLKNKSLSTDEEISKAVEHGRYVYKELEALWFLKKYRTIKSRYLDREADELALLQKELEDIANKL